MKKAKEMKGAKNGYTKQATAKALAEEREVAQPSRFVKDKRPRRAFGILDKPCRLSCVVNKSLHSKLCLTELPMSDGVRSQRPFAFRQSRTRP